MHVDLEHSKIIYTIWQYFTATYLSLSTQYSVEAPYRIDSYLQLTRIIHVCSYIYIDPYHPAPITKSRGIVHSSSRPASATNSQACSIQWSTMATLKASILAILRFAFLCGAALAARDLNDDSAMVARHEQWMAQYNRVYKEKYRSGWPLQL